MLDIPAAATAVAATAATATAVPDPLKRDAALWRPSAVAAWSLVFTPVFGSYLLMRNWQALGQPQAAVAARRWLRASLGVLALELIAGAINRRLNGGFPFMQWLALAWLGLWLLAAALPQWQLVRRRFGRAYARQEWNGALATAVAFGVLSWSAGGMLTWLLLAFT
ncbi:MAG: hypothetical protein ABWY02_15165 [Telluria sp.]